MKGSLPLPVDPPNTENPWVTSTPDSSTAESPSYSEIFGIYASRDAALLMLDPDVYPRDFLASEHPMALEVNENLAGFDIAQRELVLSDQLRSVENQVRKTPGLILHAPADSSEWQQWCQLQAERVAATSPSLSKRYLALAQSPPPSIYELSYLMRARVHARAVAQSYDREMRYLSGYLGKDVDDVRIAVEAQRLAYLRTSESERPEVPGWFVSGLDSSYWGRDRIRRPPTDSATLWGLYSVLTDPRISENLSPHSSQEYVVFDTETTGLSDQAAIIQITAIRYNNEGQEQERISTYLRPEDPAVFDGPDAQRASEVTGITYETVKDAPTFSDISSDLRSMMMGRTLVAHNLMFDYPRVQRAFAASGPAEASVDDKVLPLSPIVDTLRLARWAQPNPGVARKEWKHTLEHACKRAGISFDTDEAHDALYDVERTNELFKYLRTAPLGGAA